MKNLKTLKSRSTDVSPVGEMAWSLCVALGVAFSAFYQVSSPQLDSARREALPRIQVSRESPGEVASIEEEAQPHREIAGAGTALR